MKKAEEYIVPCLRCGKEFDALKVVHRCNRNNSWDYLDDLWADPILPEPYDTFRDTYYYGEES